MYKFTYSVAILFASSIVYDPGLIHCPIIPVGDCTPWIPSRSNESEPAPGFTANRNF